MILWFKVRLDQVTDHIELEWGLCEELLSVKMEVWLELQ